ncbi:uncharacterized protein LOC122231725 [Panthera tigris]|uniref:uncharacterized protein LOC122231725 n=1 Tax=Panthera tigris TaxID=9694 RepID=UPI001C6FB09C|nr:uncharacterized protein LOC122231725 [Panthera tigris]
MPQSTRAEIPGAAPPPEGHVSSVWGHLKVKTENNSYINFYRLHCDAHLPCLIPCSSHNSLKGTGFLSLILQRRKSGLGDIDKLARDVSFLVAEPVFTPRLSDSTAPAFSYSALEPEGEKVWVFTEMRERQKTEEKGSPAEAYRLMCSLASAPPGPKTTISRRCRPQMKTSQVSSQSIWPWPHGGLSWASMASGGHTITALLWGQGWNQLRRDGKRVLDRGGARLK